MKHIQKQVEPLLFTQWKAAHPGATYKDDLCNFSDADAMAARVALKNNLLVEQKYICCYCECRVSDANSHIEHFKPKDVTQFPLLQLEYSNLFVSCTKRPTHSPDEHCGHKKDNFYSPDLVSPLEPDCSSHFAYKMDGTIEGTDDRGRLTINKLHLDSALLDNQRKCLIDGFLGINDDTELKREIDEHLNVNNNILGEFYTMVEYLHASGQL